MENTVSPLRSEAPVGLPLSDDAFAVLLRERPLNWEATYLAGLLLSAVKSADERNANVRVIGSNHIRDHEAGVKYLNEKVAETDQIMQSLEQLLTNQIVTETNSRADHQGNVELIQLIADGVERDYLAMLTLAWQLDTVTSNDELEVPARWLACCLDSIAAELRTRITEFAGRMELDNDAIRHGKPMSDLYWNIDLTVNQQLFDSFTSAAAAYINKDDAAPIAERNETAAVLAPQLRKPAPPATTGAAVRPRNTWGYFVALLAILVAFVAGGYVESKSDSWWLTSWVLFTAAGPILLYRYNKTSKYRTRREARAQTDILKVCIGLLMAIGLGAFSNDPAGRGAMILFVIGPAATLMAGLQLGKYLPG